MICDLNYEWVLEGDLDATVTLHLTCDCVVQGITLQSVTLTQVECERVEFSLRREKLRYDRSPQNPRQPDPLLQWLSQRFFQRHAESPAFQQEIVHLIEGQALNAYWEAMAA